MKFRFFLALFTAVLFLAGCGDDEDKKSSDTPTEANATQPQSETEAVIQVDYTAPFTLQLSNGKILNMQKTKQGFHIDNNSTVTLFAFFTPWCDACAVQVSALNAAKQAYSGKMICKSPQRYKSINPLLGVGVIIILFNSSSMRSPLIIFILSALRSNASKVSSSIKKFNCVAKRTHRIIRNGSSEKVTSGSKGKIQ